MEKAIISLDKIVIDLKTREWCKLPYPGHPNGCPNYGIRDTCPPQAPLFENLISPPYILVGVKFDLENWINSMREKHPNWTYKQLSCCLYWQGKVRKTLKNECKEILTKDTIACYIPEAMGVHVFQTCANVGIVLERNPKKYVWKIAIIGRRKIM